MATNNTLLCCVFTTGKNEILVFLEKFPAISHPWEKVRSKVFNEQQAAKKRQKMRLHELSVM